MPGPIETATSPTTSLLNLFWDAPSWTLTLGINLWLVLTAAAIAILLSVLRWLHGDLALQSFEIDQAEIGVGSGKLRFKPNRTDKQVAYAIWVELSTRKIGLPIDFEHDVIAEIYDSWFHFFSVTRDLIKGIPVNQVKRHSTQAIIKLSVEVLNEGLRPHLTQWQARFRRWYGHELDKSDTLDPQQIQNNFPQYDDLVKDLKRVNHSLIRYRAKMHELVLKTD